jgi:K+-sensing histidine kinase KdpD
MSVKNKSVLDRERLILENERLRGDLLTVATRVSHDLRSPLGGISSAGEILKEILAEKEPSSASLADSLFNSVDELSKIIKQIGFVLKASATPCSKEKIQMSAVVSDALQRLESRILKSRVTIVKPDSWPEIEGVASWLEMVWWNFLTNALQHAGESPRIEMGWRKETGKIQFWISDSGPGVPAEKQKNLFQKFDSLHRSGGSGGLGLSVVQRLVELQDGVCGYEPNPKGGARFFFTLPAPER